MTSESKEVDTKLIFIAYRNPRKVFMYHWKDLLEESADFQLDPETLHTNSEEPLASEVHSIDFVFSQGQSFLLLGMRHGYMISCKLERDFNDKDSLAFFRIEAQANKFGQSQVEFITATHDDFEESQGRYEKSRVFVKSDYLWQISVQDGELRIDEVLFDDIRMVA